jgi:hypothetical protein
LKQWGGHALRWKKGTTPFRRISKRKNNFMKHYTVVLPSKSKLKFVRDDSVPLDDGSDTEMGEESRSFLPLWVETDEDEDFFAAAFTLGAPLEVQQDRECTISFLEKECQKFLESEFILPVLDYSYFHS